MARTRRIKRDGDACYHLMSRKNDRRFLFEKGRVKGEIVSLLRRTAAFSRVRLEAWCVMGDSRGVFPLEAYASHGWRNAG